MSIWKRITIAALCAIIAIVLMLIDDTFFLGALFGIAGIYILRRHLMISLKFVWHVANKRADKVAKARQCALCSAPPIYMLHLIAIDPMQTISPLAGNELHVCQAHHPNKEIATKADELHQLIKRMDRNLTYDRVYPYIFYDA